MTKPGSSTRPATTRRFARWAALVGAVVLVGAGCAASGGDGPDGTVRVVVARARFPVALTPTPDGGFLYAERLTGRVRQVDRNGTLAVEPVATVAVSTEGQRGLLGLAIDGRGRIFGASTSADEPLALEVAELSPTPRVVWQGPPSTRIANGGHLLYDETRGRLILGVGDLGKRAEVANPDTPNGKLLLLDPDGRPDQRPAVLSKGWNNPFAFTLTADGDLWVADNVPGERGERLARGDQGGRPTHVTTLPANTVPSAVTTAPDRMLVVCSFARGRTLAYRVERGRAEAASGFGDDVPCATGAATSKTGDVIWLAGDRVIRSVSRQR